MRHPAAMALAIALVTGSASASDVRPAQAVVELCFRVSEQSPQRLAQALVEPAQRALMVLNGVTELNSAATHGYVRIEIRFEAGATEKDVATVSRQVEELVSESEIPVTSHTVRLAAARF